MQQEERVTWDLAWAMFAGFVSNVLTHGINQMCEIGQSWEHTAQSLSSPSLFGHTLYGSHQQLDWRVQCPCLAFLWLFFFTSVLSLWLNSGAKLFSVFQSPCLVYLSLFCVSQYGVFHVPRLATSLLYKSYIPSHSHDVWSCIPGNGSLHLSISLLSFRDTISVSYWVVSDRKALQKI